jgi:hypothetical protein
MRGDSGTPYCALSVAVAVVRRPQTRRGATPRRAAPARGCGTGYQPRCRCRGIAGRRARRAVAPSRSCTESESVQPCPAQGSDQPAGAHLRSRFRPGPSHRGPSGRHPGHRPAAGGSRVTAQVCWSPGRGHVDCAVLHRRERVLSDRFDLAGRLGHRAEYQTTIGSQSGPLTLEVAGVSGDGRATAPSWLGPVDGRCHVAPATEYSIDDPVDSLVGRSSLHADADHGL